MKSRKNDLESGFTLIEVIITLVVVAIVAAMMTAYFGKGITGSSVPIFRLNAAASLNEILEKISAHYSQYPQWQKNTTYTANTIILPTTPERTGLLYKANNTGTSGDTQPTWPLEMNGTTVLDGTITSWTTVWTSLQSGPAPTLALNGWLPGHSYTTTPVSIVYANGGNQYICITGGTSGNSTPTWTTTSSPPISDGTTVQWQWVGPAPTLVLQSDINTNSTTTVFGSNYSVIHNKFIKFDTSGSPATEVDLTGSTTDPDYGKYLKVTIGLPSGAATNETLTTLFVLR